MERCKVLVYSDATVYGGHEMTLCDAVDGIVESGQFDVVIMVSQKNSRFRQRLSALQHSVRVIETEFETERGDVFRALFSTKKVRLIAERMRSLSPDVVIVSQGAIGLSACGLKAAKRIPAHVVSFLPMAHSVSLVRGCRSISVVMQEILYRYLYTIPDCFFTICQSTAELLRNNYGIKPDNIAVSYYGVEAKEKPPVSYKKAKAPFESKRIGIIGRVEFIQKRHDFFLRAFATSDLRDNSEIYIIGDGPDLEQCKELTLQLGIAARVHFEGWVKDVQSWYRYLDLVALPSRFEGLPLVLIETMLYGVPIVASRVDGMKEFLPDQWLFDEGDEGGMLRVMSSVLEGDQTEHILKNQDIVFEKLNKESFQRSFCQNLLQVCPHA